jgi:hypothetical protein
MHDGGRGVGGAEEIGIAVGRHEPHHPDLGDELDRDAVAFGVTGGGEGDEVREPDAGEQGTVRDRVI